MSSQKARALLIMTLSVMMLSVAIGTHAQQLPVQRTSQGAGPQWVDLDGPIGAMRATVLRPPGAGPFPLLVVFHGANGISQQLLDWGAKFAQEGYVVFIGCWSRHIPTPSGAHPAVVACPTLPVVGDARMRAPAVAGALIDAARRVPGVQSESVGLVGWSAGGALAAVAASSEARVQAVVAIAGALRYPLSRGDAPAMNRVAQLQAPVLLLHGRRDVVVDVEESIAYEAAARAAGKIVEIFIYENADHLLIFDSATRDDVYRRSLAFLSKYLRP